MIAGLRRWWRQPSLDNRLASIDTMLARISTTIEDNHMDLTRLTQEVADTRGAVDSAIVALKGVANAIRQYKTDQVALDKLADDLDAQQANIAAAIVEVNTPPVDPTVPVPAPTPVDHDDEI